MTTLLFLILFTETWNTVGQIFFKKATHQLGTPHLKNLASYWVFIGRVLRKPALWLGFVSLAIGITLWLAALSQGELSLVYPISSLQYLLTLAAARIFLNEKIDRMRIVGTLLVSMGIILIVKS